MSMFTSSKRKLALVLSALIVLSCLFAVPLTANASAGNDELQYTKETFPSPQLMAPGNSCDLVITSIGTGSASAYDGDYITLYAIVRNQGNIASSAVVDVEFAVDGKKLQTKITNQSIPAGGMKVISTTMYWNAFFGSHKIRAAVNNSGLSSESNVSNNVFSQRVKVIDDINPNPVSTTEPPEQPHLPLGPNPIITHMFTADPSARVWDDGKIYIYASHDIFPARGCDLMDKYHVFSSYDMVNWTDEGEILSSDDNTWGRPEGGFMWAPDCVYRNGTYYFYYPHPSGSGEAWNNTWKIGVATSKSPAKDFKDQGYMQGLGGTAMIDPNVFIDDDGKAYFYYGGGSNNNNCLGGELNDDMMSIKGGMKVMQGVQDFHEGMWVFKRKGIYYLTYADNYTNGGNRMRYCTSTSPLGPWTYRGVFLEPTGSDTTHGSVVQFNGAWYVFYHNQALSNQGNLRSVCVDKLEFNGDGTIKPVIQSQSIQPTPEPAPSGGTEYKANNCIVGGGATLETIAGTSDKNVGNFHLAGSYCDFINVDGGNGGQATLYIRYASADGMPGVGVKVNDVDYSVVAAYGNESWSSYTAYAKVVVNLKPGAVNTVRLTGGYYGINIASIIIKK